LVYFEDLRVGIGSDVTFRIDLNFFNENSNFFNEKILDITKQKRTCGTTPSL
jgi:hypothetical protein